MVILCPSGIRDIVPGLLFVELYILWQGQVCVQYCVLCGRQIVEDTEADSLPCEFLICN